jgi:protein-tyrosine-phosphatase
LEGLMMPAAPGPLSSRPASVLYACGLNVIRSPMAAALTRQLFPGRIYSVSAGVRRGSNDPFVLNVMDEIGIDLSGHEPHTFEDLKDSNFDLVVTLAPEAHHKALDFSHTLAMQVEYWPTADPSLAHGSRDQILDAYRTVRETLMQRIKRRLDWRPGMVN